MDVVVDLDGAWDVVATVVDGRGNVHGAGNVNDDVNDDVN